MKCRRIISRCITYALALLVVLGTMTMKAVTASAEEHNGQKLTEELFEENYAEEIKVQSGTINSDKDDSKLIVFNYPGSNEYEEYNFKNGTSVDFYQVFKEPSEFEYEWGYVQDADLGIDGWVCIRYFSKVYTELYPSGSGFTWSINGHWTWGNNDEEENNQNTQNQQEADESVADDSAQENNSDVSDSDAGNSASGNTGNNSSETEETENDNNNSVIDNNSDSEDSVSDEDEEADVSEGLDDENDGDDASNEDDYAFPIDKDLLKKIVIVALAVVGVLLAATVVMLIIAKKGAKKSK